MALDSTDGSQTLSPAATGADAPGRAGDPSGCPRCAEPWGPWPAVFAGLLPDVPLRRCRRCGARYAAGQQPTRWLVTCAGCGLPLLHDGRQVDARLWCADCCEGVLPADLPEGAFAEATEAEVLEALARQWRFANAPRAEAYMGRVLSHLARHVEPLPANATLQLIDNSAWISLALPSGRILLSTGLLERLDDEAELAFVLAHELVHATSGDAAARLVRFGLQAVAEHRDAPDREVWTRAATDLVRLGYGRQRELEADRLAGEAVLALGYAATSIERLLERLQRDIALGDAALHDTGFAHPLIKDRLATLGASMDAQIDMAPATPRDNRALFRRVVGAEALRRELRSSAPESVPTSPGDTVIAEAPGPVPAPGSKHWIWWVAAALAGGALGLLALLG